MADKRQNISEQAALLEGPGGTYRGYRPIIATDFPYEEDVEIGRIDKEADVDPSMLRDARQTSLVHLVLMCFFAVLFLTFVIWQILIALCKVNHFCDMLEKSSQSTTLNTPALRIPAVYVWSGLTVAAISLAIAAWYSFNLMRKPVGTARIVEIATNIYESSHSILNYQLRAYLLPVVCVFMMLGFGVSWQFSSALLFGAIISKVAATLSVSIGTRTNLRVTAAARNSFNEAASIAFRSGSVIGIGITSLALLGVSTIYLMLEDVRALIPFVAGVSLVALICRVIGVIYTSATNMGSRLTSIITRGSNGPMNGEIILEYLKFGGDRLGDIASVGIEMLGTFALAVAVCALLGSLLPFINRDPFSICVMNHLYVDFICGSFGYPKTLSYAIYICRSDNIYQTYPALSTWQSNSTFIAIPYLLSCASLLVTIICTSWSYKPKAKNENKESLVKKLVMGFRVNVLIGAILMTGALFAVCFIMLGPTSAFQKAAGLGSNDLNYYQLDEGSVQEICKARYELANSTDNPIPIPHGKFTKGYYKPVSVLGYHFGAASSSAWKLFFCGIIGLGLGMFLDFSSHLFTSIGASPTRRVAESSEYGAGAMIVQGLATGFLSAIIPTILVAFAILGSFALFGTYGTALLAFGLLFTFGIVISVDSSASIANSSTQISNLVELPQGVQNITSALETAGRSGSSTGKTQGYAASLISSFGLISALLYMARLAPSSRDVIGTMKSEAAVHIDNVTPISMSDIRVRLSIGAGAFVPFLFAGLVLTATRKVAIAVAVGSRKTIIAAEKQDKDGKFIKANLIRCMSSARKSALLESVLPVLVMLTLPLTIGWGFGQQTMIGFLISAVSSIFVFGTAFSDSGQILANAVKLLELETLGAEFERGSERHKSSLICESVGRLLKESSGCTMSILMKLLPCAGYITVQRMYADGTRGWIGAIILGILLLVAAMFKLWKRRWNSEFEQAVEVATEDQEMPPKQLSPFFVQETQIDTRAVVPGSHLDETISAAGGTNALLTPSMLRHQLTSSSRKILTEVVRDSARPDAKVSQQQSQEN